MAPAMGSASGPRIADAGRAPVADEVEAKGIEVLLQPGLGEIIADHLGARRERGLDPRLDAEPARDGVAGEQPGAEHHRGVRGVGAARDGGDHDVAVAEVVRAAGNGDPAVRAAGCREFLLEHRREGRGGARQRNPVLRALGPREARLDGAEVEFEGVGEHRIGCPAPAPHTLALGVGLDERDRGRLAARGLEVGDGLGVDGKEAAGGAILRRHVGDRRAIGERKLVEPVAVELDELTDHALLAQHLGHGQNDVGRGGALARPPAELEADDLGDQHRDRLAQHRRLGLDATDTPAEYREAVDHGGVAIGADEGVGVGEPTAPRFGGPHDLGQVFEVDLVADAGAGRHDPEIVERRLPPAQKGIALVVALVLELDVGLEGAPAAVIIDHHGMVDNEVDRRQWVDRVGVGAELGHGPAHGGQVDDRRHAGEILHQHPRGAIGDLAVDLAALQPSRERLDVGHCHGAPVLVAQQILEQHLERVRQPREVPEPSLFGRLETEIVVGPAAHGEAAAGLQAVETGGCHGVAPSRGRAGRGGEAARR